VWAAPAWVVFAADRGPFAALAPIWTLTCGWSGSCSLAGCPGSNGSVPRAGSPDRLERQPRSKYVVTALPAVVCWWPTIGIGPVSRGQITVMAATWGRLRGHDPGSRLTDCSSDRA
jgi:hypothetical protein